MVKFQQPSPTNTLTPFVPGDPVPLAATQVVMALLLLVSNIFAIIIIVRSNLAKSRPSVFVIHLIVCDGYRGIIAFVTGAYTLSVGRMENSSCRIIGFFGLMSVTMASFALPLLLYDRLLFISSPVNYTHRMSRKFIAFLITFNTLQAILLGVIPLNGWGSYEYSDVIAACSIFWMDPAGFPALVVVWVHFIPLFTSVICFIRIVFWMKRRICQVRMNTQMKVNWVQDQTFKDANLPMQLIGKTLFFVLAFYYISWFPYFFFIILMIAGVNMGGNTAGIFAALTVLTLVTSLVNPWLYWLPSSRFRRSVRGMLPCSVESVYAETEVASIEPPRNRSASMFVLNNYPIGASANVSTVTSC